MFILGNELYLGFGRYLLMFYVSIYNCVGSMLTCYVMSLGAEL